MVVLFYLLIAWMVAGEFALSTAVTPTTVVGISVQEKENLQAIANLPICAQCSVRLCFDWQPGGLTASDEVFNSIARLNWTIERFQPDQQLSRCGLEYASLHDLSWLHIHADSAAWTNEFASRISGTNLPPSSLHLPAAETKELNRCFRERCHSSLGRKEECFDSCLSSYDPTVIWDSLDRNDPKTDFDSDSLQDLGSLLGQRVADHRIHDGPCQLWWPWNHSDIFIHKPVSASLQLLRLRAKAIIRCADDGGSVRDKRAAPVLMELDDCLDWDEALQRCRQGTTTAFLLSSAEGGDAFTVGPPMKNHDVEIIVQIPFRREPVRDKYMTFRIISGVGTVLAQYFLHQRVVYNGDMVPSPQLSRPNQWIGVHPIVTQLDSRDDLGFALSSLFVTPQRDSFTSELSSSPVTSKGKVWVEVGVQAGNFAELILRTTTADELSTYIGVDAWHSWPEDAYVDTANHGLGGNYSHRAYRQQAEQRLSGESDYLLGRNRYLIAQPSIQAAQMVANASVDIVYIDAMHHYTAVWADLLSWWPKVKPCGILAGHDYLLSAVGDETIFTVKPAVQEFARALSLLLVQTNDEEQPSFPTWLIFKPCTDR